MAEAVAGTRAVVLEARELAEDRVGLLAETLLRGLDPSWVPSEVVRESLPWAVRLPGPGAGRPRAAGARRRTPCCGAGRGRRGPRRLRAGWAATASTPGCSWAGPSWPRRHPDRRPPRSSPPSTTARRCSCRCAPPTPSTAWRRWPRRAGSGRPASSPPPRSRCASRGWPRAWGYSPGDTVAPAARAPEEWIDGAELSAQAVALITALFNQPASAAPSAARRADRGRAPGGRAGRRRPHQPKDRGGAVRLPAHGGRPPDAHLPQARHQLAVPPRGDGDQTGAPSSVSERCSRGTRARSCGRGSPR